MLIKKFTTPIHRGDFLAETARPRMRTSAAHMREKKGTPAVGFSHFPSNKRR